MLRDEEKAERATDGGQHEKNGHESTTITRQAGVEVGGAGDPNDYQCTLWNAEERRLKSAEAEAFDDAENKGVCVCDIFDGDVGAYSVLNCGRTVS